MNEPTSIPISVLDLAPIVQNGSAAQALRNARDLAQHAEAWGYKRFWLAEHHNMPGIASAATAVALAYVAGGTSTIRVGAGGIMLPNHAPLVIAEQFGTLAALFPDRVDLGLGRAPGTDPLTMRALRRGSGGSAEDFPQDVIELMSYFRDAEPDQRIRAIPGVGLKVPVWLLGSSLYSAQLAAMLGLPFAFAAHFAPELLLEALAVYRSRFRPSADLAKPYAMACVNVFLADTDAEALRLFTSLEQAFAALRRGQPGPLPPPLERPAGESSTKRDDAWLQRFRYSFVGAPSTVQRGLSEFLALTEVDELMSTAMMYDHAARLRSFEMLAALWTNLRRPPKS